MATELETNLEFILEEKTNKLLPENIKKGITILGVTGTYEGSASETQSPSEENNG